MTATTVPREILLHVATCAQCQRAAKNPRVACCPTGNAILDRLTALELAAVRAWYAK